MTEISGGQIWATGTTFAVDAMTASTLRSEQSRAELPIFGRTERVGNNRFAMLRRDCHNREKEEEETMMHSGGVYHLAETFRHLKHSVGLPIQNDRS